MRSQKVLSIFLIVLCASCTGGLSIKDTDPNHQNTPSVDAPAPEPNPDPTPTPIADPACPTNYVKVLANTALSTSTFCISQFEMKVATNDGAAVFDGYNGGVALDASLYKPESRPSGVPWVKILYTDMKSECASLGANYHLATLKEWQAAALDIESTDSNWSSGVSGNGRILNGHSDSEISASAITDGYAVAGSLLLAAGNGTDPFAGTGQTASLNWDTGFNQKRTFNLSSGDTIWDMAGNARDIVDIDGLGGTLNYTGPSSSNFYEISSSELVTMIATAITSNSVSIGTTLIYPALNLTNTTNKIGLVYLNGGTQTSRLISRGGNFSSGNSPGLFAADMDQASTGLSGTGGFRCVTSPE